MKATELIGRTWSLIAESGGWLSIAEMAMTVLGALLPVGLLWTIGRLVDATIATVGAGDGIGGVAPWALTFGVVLLLTTLQGIAERVVSMRLRGRIEMRVNEMTHSKSQSLSHIQKTDPAFQTTMYRAMRGSGERVAATYFTMVEFLQGILTFGAMSGWLARATWWMPLAVIAAGLPVMAVRVSAARSRHELEKSLTESERRKDYLSRVLTNIDYSQELQMFGIGGRFAREHAEQDRATERKRQRHVGEEATKQAIAATVSAVLMVMVFLMVIYEVASGGLTIGLLATLLLAIRRADTAMTGIAMRTSTLQSEWLRLEEFYKFMDTEPASSGDEKFPKDFATIELRDVTFRYPGSGRTALSHMNMTIRRGETVAIVGPNGSGKSTIAQIIGGLLTPTEGHASIGGVEIASISRDDMSQHVTALFQDFRLFCTTATENIAFGRSGEEIDEEEIHRAARATGIDSLLRALPQGYATTLGNRFAGSEMFSRGEWQRLALTRVMYSRAEIVILDEPSSALDTAAREELRHVMDEMRGEGRTIVMITHSEDMAAMADREIRISARD